MGIQDAFCPRCGKISDGICEVCRGQDIPWVRIDPRISCTYCPTCGSLKEPGTWVQYRGERQDLIDRLVHSALHFAPSVKDAAFSVSCEDRSSNRTTCTVGVTGNVHGEQKSAMLDLEVVWKGELCLRCSRQSGGYYEGVVQVRATRRPLTDREKGVAIQCAQEVENRIRDGGDTLTFISRFDEVHGGIDIIIGTQGLGRMIVQALIDRLGGTVTTHPKLVGERDGTPLYRITSSVRLPRFQKGDVVEANGRYGEVRESDGKRVNLFDLERGEAKVQVPDSSWRVVGNVHAAIHVLVAFRDRGVLGLIDPRSGITREVPQVPWIEPAPGAQVRAVADDERETLVIVG